MLMSIISYVLTFCNENLVDEKVLKEFQFSTQGYFGKKVYIL